MLSINKIPQPQPLNLPADNKLFSSCSLFMRASLEYMWAIPQSLFLWTDFDI